MINLNKGNATISALIRLLNNMHNLNIDNKVIESIIAQVVSLIHSNSMILANDLNDEECDELISKSVMTLHSLYKQLDSLPEHIQDYKVKIKICNSYRNILELTNVYDKSKVALLVFQNFYKHKNGFHTVGTLKNLISYTIRLKGLEHYGRYDYDAYRFGKTTPVFTGYADDNTHLHTITSVSIHEEKPLVILNTKLFEG